MLAHIARRIVLAGFTFWMISVLAFVIIELPEGDAIDLHFEAFMRAGNEMDRARLEPIRRYLGFDQPQHVRYGKWIWHLMQGGLGFSFYGARQTAGGDIPPLKSVKRIIGERL
jgi:peptide/nickel transport system permease protein